MGSQRVGHDWVTEQQQQQEGLVDHGQQGTAAVNLEGMKKEKVGFFCSSGLWWLLSHGPYVFLGSGFHSPQL